jgi:hypothetical protein
LTRLMILDLAGDLLADQYGPVTGFLAGFD